MQKMEQKVVDVESNGLLLFDLTAVQRVKENEMALVKATGRGTTVDNKKVCTSLSYSNRWPQTCCKPVKFVRDGIGYCGIHDPVHEAEMQRKRDEKAAKRNQEAV